VCCGWEASWCTAGAATRSAEDQQNHPIGFEMPFKSRAQRRKFAELLVKGEISPETFEEWNRSTGSVKLPERVKGKSKQGAKPRSNKRKTAAKRSKKKPNRQTK
jgi:hypothetical protein